MKITKRKSSQRFKFAAYLQMMLLMLGVCSMNSLSAANNSNQKATVSLQLEEVALKTVFQNIEKQTEFTFFYENDVVDVNKTVSINGKNLSVESVLTKVLKGTDIEHKFVDKQIVLVKKGKVDKTATASPTGALNIKTITGQVLDPQGVPLPGVNIIVKGTAKGTQTDFDGNYSVEANEGDTLVFSFVGFITTEEIVTRLDAINITLEEDVAALNEVVVIGYGSAKRSDLTGAVTTVTAKSFENQPVTRVEEALQGRTAGVSVARANGTPGGDVKVRIRGVNSISGSNNPLVVIDGILGGDLRTLNPSDIQSFEVLKDASALAIYGSRGANGVILVNTKRGKGKAKFDLNVFSSISELAESYDGILSPVEFARRNDFSDEDIADLIANPVNDKEDDLFRTAFAQNAQLSVSGGSDSFNYFLSGNYTDQEGIMITNKYQRYSLRANFESRINDRFKVGLKLFTTRETDSNNPNNFSRVFGGPVLQTLTLDPTRRQRNEDGSFNFASSPFGRNTSTPFVTNLLRSDNERRADRLNGNLNIDYKISNSLKYTLLVGVSTRNQRTQELRIESDKTQLRSQDDRASVSYISDLNYQVTNILNWNKTFGKHRLDVTGVYEFQRDQRITDVSRINNLERDVDSFFLVDDSAVRTEDRVITYGLGETGIQSYVGRLNYNFNESLLLTGSIRRDESTALAKGNRVSYFPSGAIAYSLKKLSFIENSSVIDDIKIRAGWGQTGNQNTNGVAFSDRVGSRTIQRGVFNEDGTPVLVDGVQEQEDVNVPILTNIGNPDITWEITTQTNFGLDVGLFNNRLNFSFDYYKKNTEDLILTRLFVESINGTFFTENIGEVENKGFDISLSGDIISNKDLTWNTGVAFSYLKNEVIELSPEITSDRIIGRVLDASREAPINVIQKGESLGSFRGLTFLGFNEDGTENFLRDEEGELVTDIIGNGLPSITWGLNNTVNYKNWDFNVFVQGSHDFEVFNQVEAALAGEGADFKSNLKDSPAGTNVSSALNSSRFIEKGDFIRLSNLTVGYTIKEPVKGINFVKLYAGGQNLFLITDYKGYDPETSSSDSTFEPRAENQDVNSGIDLGAIPNPRTYTIGLKLGF